MVSRPSKASDRHARRGESGESRLFEDNDRDATEETLRRKMSQGFESLRNEFADISPERVTAFGEAEFDRLRSDARITEFIPVLVHRYAREDLLRLREQKLRPAA